MSQASPPAQAAVPPTKPLFPPEERFWQRYSPEHEAPISTVSSVVLHILMFTLLVALSLGLLNFTRNTEPIGVTVVEVDPDFDTPSSDSGAPPGGGGPVAVEKRDDRIKFEELEELPKAPAVRVSAAELPLDLRDDPALQQAITADTEAVKRLEGLDKSLREQLFAGVAKAPGPPGPGGGKGQGKEGSGTGVSTKTGTRVMRWTMKFNTFDGFDYLRQLRAMKAILAFPQANGRVVTYDLSKMPHTPETGDLRKINRMYWIDNSPESMRGIAVALKLRFLPNQMIAFFPEELERRLLGAELDYMDRTYGRRDEDAIHQTFFDITVEGQDYRVRVADMQLKGR
jgi:hypothetical protein